MNSYYELPRKMREEAMRAADEELRKKHSRGEFDDGDPNHPKYNHGINYTRCFGLTWDSLLAKQYTGKQADR